ncbi:class I histocompatibility antigen, F10 alpha chain-like, partial [Arapaima gigas]
YQPLCVRTLRRYLQEDKNILLRKERPRVRVTQRTEAHSGRTQVSCLATGFYPRRINVTLLRD